MRKNFLLYSGLITIIFVFIQFTVGFNFEFLESHLPSMLSGKTTNGHPLNVMFFSAHYPLADYIYVPLYNYFDGYFPFYEIFMYLSMMISGGIIATVVHEKVKNRKNLFQFAITISLASIFIFLTLNLQHTVVAFLSCTAASALLYLDLDRMSKRKRVFVYLISIILFVTGLFIRVQVGVFFAIINLFAFILVKSVNEIGRYVVFTMLIITITHYGILLKNRNISTDYCQKMDLVIGYQLIDRGNIVPLETMRSYEDSIKYISAIHAISDPKYLTIDFIESLIADHPIFGIKQQYFERAYFILLKFCEVNIGLLLIYFVVIILTIHSHKKNKRKFYGWILFNTFFLGLIALVTYNIKMEPWLFRSAFFSIIILHTLNLRLDIKDHQLLFQVSIPVILFGLVLFTKQEISHFSTVRQRTIDNKKTLSIIAQKCNGSIVVPGLSQSSIYMASFFPFEEPDFSAYKHVFHFDTDVFFWQKAYNEWIKNECKCETGDAVSFLDYLSKNHAKYISTVKRTEELKAYCSAIRNVNYEFTIEDSLMHKNNTLYIFSIARTKDKNPHQKALKTF